MVAGVFVVVADVLRDLKLVYCIDLVCASALTFNGCLNLIVTPGLIVNICTLFHVFRWLNPLFPFLF